MLTTTDLMLTLQCVMQWWLAARRRVADGLLEEGSLEPEQPEAEALVPL